MQHVLGISVTEALGRSVQPAGVAECTTFPSPIARWGSHRPSHKWFSYCCGFNAGRVRFSGFNYYATGMKNEKNGPCCLCKRITKRGTTAHHLIPRTCHSNRWFRKQFTREVMQQTVELCHDCHNAIHRFIPREKQLGRNYYTLELLLEHEQIRDFVAWISKQK